MSEPFDTRTGRVARKTPLSILSDVGKLLPQSTEIEEAVLGALMLERDAFGSIDKILEPDSFYKDEHREIFEAMRALYRKDHPIDLLTVVNELRSTGKLEGAGGSFYISELTNRVSSSANIEYHSRIVAQKFILRQLITVTTNIQRDAYDEMSDVFDILEYAKVEMDKIGVFDFIKPEQKLGDVVHELAVEAKEVQPEISNAGIPSTYRDFDKRIGLFQFGTLNIIAGRPAMGKSALAMNILYRLAASKYRYPVAIFSYEMKNTQLAARILAPVLKVTAREILQKNLLQSKIEELASRVSVFTDIPLYMDDNTNYTIIDLKKKIRMMVKKYGIKLVAVDYIQLVKTLVSDKRGRQVNRDEELGTITRGLKELSMELNIAIIALSQLSRKVEDRKDKRPILSDLKESGSIEADADHVSFIYRPEYYAINETEVFGQKVSSKGVAAWIIEKDRYGETPLSIALKFEGAYTSFSDWESEGSNLFQRQDEDEDQEMPF